MSQRECAGFNWPPLAISAEEPVSISPEAVSRAGPLRARTAAMFNVMFFAMQLYSVPRCESVTVSVGHPASTACRPS